MTGNSANRRLSAEALAPWRRWPAVLAAVAAAALALAGCTGSGGASSATASWPAAAATSAAASGTAAPDASGAGAIQNAFVSVINRVLPSVVEIRTSSGLGSGVVYDSKGDIVTNAHVVGTATKFEVLPAGSG